MHVLGIDIGGSGITGAPVDTSTGVLLADRHRIETPASGKPTAIAKVVQQIATHFAWQGPIGCTVPAVVQQGIVKTAANIHPSWIGLDFRSLVTETTGRPAAVLNDADAAGLASMQFGVSRGRRDLVLFLTVGTGIGSALFIDQRLVPNTEFGHIILEGMDAEQFCSDRVRKDEDLSWPVWTARFQNFLARIESLLYPDLIVIGGGISRPKKKAKYFDALSTQAELLTASLENEAGLIGAAAAAARA